MLSKIGYYLLKGISRMPFWFIYALSDVASWVLCYVVRYRRKTVLDNLRLCFPEQSPAWRRRVARRFYRGFSDTMLEALKMFTLSPQKAKERLRYENPQEFEQMLASGRNHLIIFGHYANWEWLMFTKLLYPRMRTIALYQRIENAFVNDCALHARERFGMEAMQAKHALLGLARLKNDGETMVAFVADQSPARPLIKHWTKFFGVDTPGPIAVHSQAVALKYDVVFLDMRRTSRGHYSVRATRIYTPGEQVAPYDIIDRFFVRLEAQIREKPEDWLWSHRRWKYCPRGEAEETHPQGDLPRKNDGEGK